MSKEDEKKRIGPPQHTHKWNLQNDEDFAAESARFLKYFINAQLNIPCVHQDHPSVMAVEIMAKGLTEDVPGLGSMIETVAHVFFAAGQQYAADGFTSSAHPRYGLDIDIAPSEHSEEWGKNHAKFSSEWRKDIRERYYKPRQKRGLAEVLKHLAEHHGEELAVIEMDESDILSRILGPQRTAPEEEQDNRAGPYL